MALQRYGVLCGVLRDHFRDQPDTQGRWYHVNLRVDAPDGRYRCAVDVDSKQSSTGVRWKRFAVDAAVLGPVAGFAGGYHELERAPGTGALDFQRHPGLLGHRRCRFAHRLPRWLREALEPFCRPLPWTAGSNLEAAEAFEPILVPGRGILVFGEPFRTGLGMHNIHQNQGDPAGSQWWDENGVWQDGATMTRREDGRFDVFLSKFSTQADRTDDEGHPV
ncbi:DUF2278 family protein [Streptomyces durbertensis]|uniref:DUF2278 family protein n=2 Tax=Streptomyces durbertensis TaxID=2448886 RepID=A0ABR6EPK5_9ACTN|nr:DUF2278 family protein [Streptomyces durbertensis]